MLRQYMKKNYQEAFSGLRTANFSLNQIHLTAGGTTAIVYFHLDDENFLPLERS